MSKNDLKANIFNIKRLKFGVSSPALLVQAVEVQALSVFHSLCLRYQMLHKIQFLDRRPGHFAVGLAAGVMGENFENGGSGGSSFISKKLGGGGGKGCEERGNFVGGGGG